MSEKTMLTARYRLEHHPASSASCMIVCATTLAGALVELAIIRRWLRAGQADGDLVVIDQHTMPELRVGTYRIPLLSKG